MKSNLSYLRHTVLGCVIIYIICCHFLWQTFTFISIFMLHYPHNKSTNNNIISYYYYTFKLNDVEID